MMIHFNQEQERDLHQTPTKKTKELTDVEPKTAESHQKYQSQIEDLTPQELFIHFYQKVKVVEQEYTNEEEEDEVEVQRKLTYDYPKPKANLFMSPAWSSMKKKSKIGFEGTHEEKVKSIVLFEVTGEEESQTTLKKVDISHLSEGECQTPRRKEDNKEPQDWSTPKKVVPKN